jgi:hypothetical protein
MSALAAWCPIIAHIDYVPFALAPLAVCVPDEHMLFEISASLLT